jgi:alpha-amylase
MYQIQSTLQSYAKSFSDMSVLGTFIDNHDQARFLSGTGDHTLYKNAIAYVLMSEGIPIIYYGTEQGYAGSSDPNNRECMWPNYNEQSELYKFIKVILEFRKKMGIATEKQIQRYADDTFYAFTRGDVFVATTNVGSNGSAQRRTITYHPYKEGTTLCNLYVFHSHSSPISMKVDVFDV